MLTAPAHTGAFPELHLLFLGIGRDAFTLSFPLQEELNQDGEAAQRAPKKDANGRAEKRCKTNGLNVPPWNDVSKEIWCELS